MPPTLLDPFLAQPERDLRRQELQIFIGPNAGSFLSAFNKMAERRQQFLGTRKLQFSWRVGFTWPVMFIGPVWFFYRKMWAWARRGSRS